jgi:hypothetical protein
MTMRKRKSYHLTQLQNQLRKRPLTEQDDETRRTYWRLYYKAQNAEHEVREMVMDAEMRRLLEFILPDGTPDNFFEDDDTGSKSKPEIPDDSIDDEDIPPRQKGLWE